MEQFCQEKKTSQGLASARTAEISLLPTVALQIWHSSPAHINLAAMAGIAERLPRSHPRQQHLRLRRPQANGHNDRLLSSRRAPDRSGSDHSSLRNGGRRSQDIQWSNSICRQLQFSCRGSLPSKIFVTIHHPSGRASSTAGW